MWTIPANLEKGDARAAITEKGLTLHLVCRDHAPVDAILAQSPHLAAIKEELTTPEAKAERAVAEGNAEALSLGGKFSSVPWEIIVDLQEVAGELISANGILDNMIKKGVTQAEMENQAMVIKRLLTDMEGLVSMASLTPISSILPQLYRIVRDISKKEGKVVRFEVEGERWCALRWRGMITGFSFTSGTTSSARMGLGSGVCASLGSVLAFHLGASSGASPATGRFQDTKPSLLAASTARGHGPLPGYKAFTFGGFHGALPGWLFYWSFRFCLGLWAFPGWLICHGIGHGTIAGINGKAVLLGSFSILAHGLVVFILAGNGELPAFFRGFFFIVQGQAGGLTDRLMQGISTRPATGSHTRPRTFLKAMAMASSSCLGVPPAISTMAAAAMAEAEPHSA